MKSEHRKPGTSVRKTNKKEEKKMCPTRTAEDTSREEDRHFHHKPPTKHTQAHTPPHTHTHTHTKVQFKFMDLSESWWNRFLVVRFRGGSECERAVCFFFLPKCMCGWGHST